MPINLHVMKEAEARAKASLFSALSSTLALYLILLLVLGISFVVLRRI